MNELEKSLQRLTKEERARVKKIVAQLEAGSFKNLDIKKLKGSDSVYRARKGNLRVIYEMRDGKCRILHIGRRNEQTYRNL